MFLYLAPPALAAEEAWRAYGHGRDFGRNQGGEHPDREEGSKHPVRARVAVAIAAAALPSGSCSSCRAIVQCR